MSLKKRCKADKALYQQLFDRLTLEQRRQLDIIDHLWKRGDHFYKLAYSYYGDPTYWWVIASYNNKPTEAGLAFGTLVFVPTPLETVLSFMEFK